MDWKAFCVEAKNFEEAVEKWKKGLTVKAEQERTGSIKIVGNKTIVTLPDGREGVARCNPVDTFDILEGIRVALEDIKNKTHKLTTDEKALLNALKLGGEQFIRKTHNGILARKIIEVNDLYLETTLFDWLDDTSIYKISDLLVNGN